MTEENTPDMFDKEYVSNLRQEAGKYRQQVRDLESQLKEYGQLEAQINAVRVENELVRRGINADPMWVQITDGDISASVDNFLEKYPHLANTPTEPAKVDTPKNLAKKAPAAMPPNPNNANTPGPQAKGSFGDRTMSEIKKDPVARETLRQTYRDLISQSSNQQGE